MSVLEWLMPPPDRGRSRLLVFGTRGPERLAPGLHNGKSESLPSCCWPFRWCWRWCWSRCLPWSTSSGWAGWARMRWRRWDSPSRCWRWCSPSAWVWRCRRPPWWRGASAKRIPRMRPLPVCRRSVVGLAISLVLGIPAGILCAAIAARDGRIAGNRRRRVGLRAHRAGRMRRDHHALPQQRDFPRRRRCGDRDAAAVGVEHHQPGARSVPDLRAWAVSAHGRDRRGAGDVYGRSIGVLYQFYRLLKGTERIHVLAATSALECARDDAAAARFA